MGGGGWMLFRVVFLHLTMKEPPCQGFNGLEANNWTSDSVQQSRQPSKLSPDSTQHFEWQPVVASGM